MFDAFDLADRYRNPVLIIADGLLGQMMEPVELPDFITPDRIPNHEGWALRGKGSREQHTITSFDLDPVKLEEMNLKNYETYQKIRENEVRYEEYLMDDAEVAFVAYGTMGRILKTTIRLAREAGIKAGLIRPITLWPFPEKPIREAAEKVRMVMSVEMSMGQMVEDVRLAVSGKVPTPFYGRTGGIVPTPTEVFEALKREWEALV